VSGWEIGYFLNLEVALRALLVAAVVIVIILAIAG
jgi:hypothetical protein